MEKPKNKEKSDDWMQNLPTQTESSGFSDSEMILCNQCQRNNPPTRLKCLYCGKDLEISEAQAELIKPRLRKMEAWENGFNLVYLPDKENSGKENLEKISKVLIIEKEVLEQIFETGKSLPIARAESEREAEIVKKNLSALGIETVVVSDEKLNVKNPPKRLRGIDFFEDHINLILFNEEKTIKIPVEDISLIVTGKIFDRKVEAVEKRNRKGDNKILHAAEMAFDEFLIDIYPESDEAGFRILEKGFDYSCLGTEKDLFASKNMPKLIAKLKEVFNDAKFIEDYVGIREVLGSIWEIENRTVSQGFHRKGFGNINLENASTTNNLTQFTKYSRMHKQII